MSLIPPAVPVTGPPAVPVTVPLTVNGEPREVSGGATLAELVAELSKAPSGVAAAVNEAVVPRGSWAGTLLAAGDRVEILTAVQGG
ncbi:sulfur carrier protein ThiS [Kitasatospora sp. NBC_01287]|uniref:sulfur carrier protein ThiS n=1 Tax=Kitasatospora sp. NBC_01287 TaxID=2903573 RepID=UPI002259BB3F|nr:sulfur carrier protein ThiS [Kitasatospora sp. NBC_01287]MCX4749585.1 sulfur carrier protein ThiS [Kitasatospora sp. NBC_01287]